MKTLIARILISAIIIIFLGWLLPGVEVSSTWKAIVAALVLGLINAIIKPILVLLTLPVTVLTLGLFLFVINACMVLLAANWIDGFDVDGFWSALIFSLLLSLLNSIVHKFVLRDHDERR